MSAASKESGSWFGQNYDKLTLVVSLILLLASSAYLLFTISGEKREIEDADFINVGVVKKPGVPVDIAAYSSNLLESSSYFDSSVITTNRLVAPEERVTCVNAECLRPIPYHASSCPWCNAKQPEPIPPDELDRDMDGIPDIKEVALGLDSLDPSDALADFDGDAFTNIEEYRFGSDLNDAKDFPPVATKLRIARVVKIPIGLILTSIRELGGDVSFQLNAPAEGNRSYFKSVGEEVKGYTLESFDAETKVLTLRKGDQVVTLERGKRSEGGDWKAKLVSLMDGRTYPPSRADMLEVGSQFEVRGSTYKVIDIDAEAVLIQDTDSGGDVSVERYTRAELQDLQYRMQNRRTEPRR